MNKILLFFLFPPFFFHSLVSLLIRKQKGSNSLSQNQHNFLSQKRSNKSFNPKQKLEPKKKKKKIYIYIYIYIEREREREREREADLNQSDHKHRVLASRTKSMHPCLWKPSWSTIGTQKKGQNRSSKTTRSIWETLGEWSLMI